MKDLFNPAAPKMPIVIRQTPEGIPFLLLSLPLVADKRMKGDEYHGLNKEGGSALVGRLFFGHLWNGVDEIVKVKAAPEVIAVIEKARKALQNENANV